MFWVLFLCFGTLFALKPSANIFPNSENKQDFVFLCIQDVFWVTYKTPSNMVERHLKQNIHDFCFIWAQVKGNYKELDDLRHTQPYSNPII